MIISDELTVSKQLSDLLMMGFQLKMFCEKKERFVMELISPVGEKFARAIIVSTDPKIMTRRMEILILAAHRRFIMACQAVTD